MYHPHDARYFVNTDETHHPFSTAGDKGGSRQQRWADPSFPRAGERTTISSRHTTGAYSVNLAGEALPPLYILDSKAEFEENFKIDPRIAIGLPEVIGIFGTGRLTSFASWVGVRRKGSMDSSMWSQFQTKIVLPCYPNIQKKIERCVLTDKILKGPVIVKTDAGPGRLAKDAKSWEFRKKMHDQGLYIMLGLPNGTSANQEMDQGYADLKRECKASTLRVASRKLAACVAIRKKALEGASRAADPLTEEDLLRYVQDAEEESDDDDHDKEVCALSYAGGICNVSLGNLDLANIVNGWPDNPVDRRPFDKIFTPANVRSWWEKVGFLPMTRASLNNPKVRWELGEGGAPEEGTVRLELLLEEYKRVAAKASVLGYNGEVLDLEPARVEERHIPDGEDDQVKALVEAKTINKAGTLFKCGTNMVNGRVMLRAKKLIDEEATKCKEAKEEKKKKAAETKEDKAIFAHGKWVRLGRLLDKNKNPKLSKEDSTCIVKVLMPRIAPKEKIGEYNSMAKCNEWLGSVAGGTTWDKEMETMTAEQACAGIQRQLEEHGRLF